MKKLLKRVCSAFLAAATVFCFASCSKGVVKDGSKIENMTVVMEYTDKDTNEAKTLNVEIELYMNYAPATIAHVKYLVANGYYTNTVVSDLKKNHIEFGEFYFDADGNRKSKYSEAALQSIAATPKSYYSIITADYAKGKKIANDTKNRYDENFRLYGEFSKNGVSCAKTLTISEGTLVVKRDVVSYNDESGYNTARGTLALVTGSDDYYTGSSSFAVIGKITKGLTELKQLITDVDFYNKDSNGNVRYYFDYENCIDSGDEDDAEVYAQFETLGHDFVKDSDGNFETVDGVDITSENYEDVLAKLNGNSKYLRAVPYKTITVKSVKTSK